MKTSSPENMKQPRRRAQFDYGDFGRDAGDVVEHAGGGVEHFVLVLREVVGEGVVA